MTSDEVREWVLDRVDEMTDRESPWSSKGKLRQEIENYEYDADAVEAAAENLVADGDLFAWHGMLTIPDDERLLGVIEAERDNEHPRSILIGKCNQRRSEA